MTNGKHETIIYLTMMIYTINKYDDRTTIRLFDGKLTDYNLIQITAKPLFRQTLDYDRTLRTVGMRSMR